MSCDSILANESLPPFNLPKNFNSVREEVGTEEEMKRKRARLD